MIFVSRERRSWPKRDRRMRQDKAFGSVLAVVGDYPRGIPNLSQRSWVPLSNLECVSV